jgi:hypothetical protein
VGCRVAWSCPVSAGSLPAHALRGCGRLASVRRSPTRCGQARKPRPAATRASRRRRGAVVHPHRAAPPQARAGPTTCLRPVNRRSGCGGPRRPPALRPLPSTPAYPRAPGPRHELSTDNRTRRPRRALAESLRPLTCEFRKRAISPRSAMVQVHPSVSTSSFTMMAPAASMSARWEKACGKFPR